mgnify:FL=1|jgi:hypothetical protein
MSNMSYCRFENTSRDLQDCLDALEELINNNGVDEYGEKLSKTEYYAMLEIAEIAENYLNLHEDFIEMIS